MKLYIVVILSVLYVQGVENKLKKSKYSLDNDLINENENSNFGDINSFVGLQPEAFAKSFGSSIIKKHKAKGSSEESAASISSNLFGGLTKVTSLVTFVKSVFNYASNYKYIVAPFVLGVIILLFYAKTLF